MKRIILLILVLWMSTPLYAQKLHSRKTLKEELIGTWTLVSVDNIYPDSSRVHPYGDHPKGLLIFDRLSNYSIQIYQANRLQIASGDKNLCTADENAMLVKGSNAHFGKYSVNEIEHTITFSIKHAFFTNWEGTEQKRYYTYTGNRISYIVTHTTQGGKAVIAEVVWQRLP